MSAVSDPADRATTFSLPVPTCVVEKCYEDNGLILPNHMPPRCTRALRNFKCRPDDTFVITYPKCGTTWMEQLMLLVHFDGDVTKMQKEKKENMHMRVPFLETVQDPFNIEASPTMVELANSMPSPRFLKSHMLPDWLPDEIRTDDPEVKVIYVARNPKDVAVSFYHFLNLLPRLPTYDSWHVFFEEYIAGRVPFGSWFDNALAWWKRRDHPNVLFMKYEDMKKDPQGAVRQVAEFMGKGHMTDDVIDKIVTASTFSAMKKNPSASPIPRDNIKDNDEEGVKTKPNPFFRKGKVGDWKTHFTVEQNERFDELYKKKMAGTGLDFIFE